MNRSSIGTFWITKRSAMYLSAVCLLSCASPMIGQTNGSKSNVVALSQPANNNTAQASSQYQRPVAEILSDTQGVDFEPYVEQALQSIGKLWLSSESAKVTSANRSQTEAIVRFTIASDGKISAMELVQSAHHIEIDRAAWASIRGVGAFPPLPTEFNGPNLVLRIGFRGSPSQP
jgi:TonB family protein